MLMYSRSNKPGNKGVLSRYKIHIVLFVFGLVLFSLPSLLRFYFYGFGDIIGFPTYLHTRIAGYIIDGTFNFYDPLSFGGRTYVYPPLFSYVLAAFGYVFGLKAGSVLFVSVFGGLGIIAFYMVMKIFLHRNHAVLAAIVLALLPVTISLYSHVSTRAVPTTISLFALYFLIKDHKKYYLHSSVLLGVAALFHPEVAVVFTIIILLYFLSFRHSLENFLRLAAIVVLISALWYVPFLFSNGFPSANDLHAEYRERAYSLESPSLYYYFWEIQGKGHLNILAGIFSVVGFALLCQNRKSKKSSAQNKFLICWAAFAFLMTLAFERLFIYLPFAAAMLAAIGLKAFSSSRHYRILVAILLLYTAFFALDRVDAIASDYPTQEQINAMLWIKDNTPADSVILSDWQWGHWISGIAERKNFIDGFAEYAPDVNKRLSELNEFYGTCSVPGGYGINYVYMESWFIKENNINCVFDFRLVYNNSYLYVFEI